MKYIGIHMTQVLIQKIGASKIREALGLSLGFDHGLYDVFNQIRDVARNVDEQNSKI